WGKPSNAGSLLGQRASARKQLEVNFREQSGIYALYADYKLVYIGQTGGKGQRLLFRLNQHRKDDLAGRWYMLSWFGTRKVLKTGNLKAVRAAAHPSHQNVLDHLEAILIHVGEPALNRQGGKWGQSVVQYLQLRDTRLGPSVSEMVEEIWDELVGG